MHVSHEEEGVRVFVLIQKPVSDGVSNEIDYFIIVCPTVVLDNVRCQSGDVYSCI